VALALNNYVTVTSIGTTNSVGIYTAPAGYNAVVLCAQAVNLSANSHDVTFAHERTTSGIAVTTYSSYKRPIATHDTLELTTGKLTLNPGDIAKVSTSTENDIHIIFTVLETLI
jgi:hypothetical protein